MDQEKIGKFIAKLRKEKDMTQQELADKLGTTNKSVSRWENGKCMPDLSLFPLLSKELNVSINDLISGEIIDKKEYQETFEKNIVKTIAKIDKSNQKWNVVCRAIQIFVLLFFVVFGIYVFIENYELKMPYNANTMSILKVSETIPSSKQILEIEVLNVYSVYRDYIMTTYTNSNDEKVRIVFVTATETISGYFKRKSIYKECTNLVPCRSTRNKIEINNEYFPINFEVYYTNISFEKIANASDKELLEIIKKSNLMYKNKVN